MSDNAATDPTKVDQVRIAVCGGPYANPHALSAFVEDARRLGASQLHCLGDLGGFGAEVDPLWKIIEEAGIECIAGNYDVALARADPDCGCGYRDPRDNEFAQLIYDYTLAHTDRSFAVWMGGLPPERRMSLGGCEVHLVHGSPLAINDFWWESQPEEEHELRVKTSGADVICCTHSGLPWQMRVAGSLVVNVGVLGKPANNGRNEVWYALIDLADGHAEARLVPLEYDFEAQASSMRKAGLPEPFAETIETGWWTTCLEVLPPAERSRGKFHLYRSSLPENFTPSGATWGNVATADEHDEGRPVVPLFASAYFPARLWLYTNFNCNLQCDYCAVSSSPRAIARTMSCRRFCSLVDEALSEDFAEIYVTGGEPLLHPDIVDMLQYSADRIATVLLTNAMLLRHKRLERFGKLAEVGHRGNLVVQTSLDGATAGTHDLHRGEGSWRRTIDGIGLLVELGFHVKVAMTETDENAGEVEAVGSLLASMGIAPEAFMVRPLLKRGFSPSGADIDQAVTVPELTVADDGVYWHPAGADRFSNSDMLLTELPISLASAKQIVTERFLGARLEDGSLPQPYRCAI